MLLTINVFCFCFDIQNNICTQHVVSLYFSGNSLNNLSLIDSRVRASKKDLPVLLINDVIGQLDITAKYTFCQSLQAYKWGTYTPPRTARVSRLKSLKITFFALKMMMIKSSLEKKILKFHEPLQTLRVTMALWST